MLFTDEYPGYLTLERKYRHRPGTVLHGQPMLGLLDGVRREVESVLARFVTDFPPGYITGGSLP
jgi:hypothetical protein